MLTFKNALFKTAASIQANEIQQKEERWLAVMPLCHIAGMVMGVNIPVFTGVCIAFPFPPERYFESASKI